MDIYNVGLSRYIPKYYETVMKTDGTMHLK